MKNTNSTQIVISLTEQEFKNINFSGFFNSHFDVTGSELSDYNEIYQKGSKVTFTNTNDLPITGIITWRDYPQKIYSLYRVRYSVKIV